MKSLLRSWLMINSGILGGKLIWDVPTPALATNHGILRWVTQDIPAGPIVVVVYPITITIHYISIILHFIYWIYFNGTLRSCCILVVFLVCLVVCIGVPTLVLAPISQAVSLAPDDMTSFPILNWTQLYKLVLKAGDEIQQPCDVVSSNPCLRSCFHSRSQNSLHKKRD